MYLRLNHGGPNAAIGTLEPDAPEFVPEQWHTIRVFIEQNGDVRLYQDGILVSRVKLTPDSRAGTVGGHTGIYAYNWYKTTTSFAGTLLVDNFEIRCW